LQVLKIVPLERFCMHDEVSEKGFLLLDNKLKLVMFNSEAVKILAYPTAP
jgi:hypothetical protein